jgi:hypothetical protein
MIFIMAAAYVVAFALATGSMAPNVHILQQAIRKWDEPSKPEAAPAKYSSMCKTKKGASIGKL